MDISIDWNSTFSATKSLKSRALQSLPSAPSLAIVDSDQNPKPVWTWLAPQAGEATKIRPWLR